MSFLFFQGKLNCIVWMKNLRGDEVWKWKGEDGWEEGKRKVKTRVENMAVLPFKKIKKFPPLEYYFPPFTNQRKIGKPLFEENVFRPTQTLPMLLRPECLCVTHICTHGSHLKILWISSDFSPIWSSKCPCPYPCRSVEDVTWVCEVKWRVQVA